MPRKTKSIASVRARIGAYAKWARTDDWAAATEPARRAFRSKFEREVDPDAVMRADERQRRAESARKAHYARLALKSAQARAKKRQRLDRREK